MVNQHIENHGLGIFWLTVWCRKLILGRDIDRGLYVCNVMV